MYLAWKGKKFEFWRVRLGGNPPSWLPQFLLSLVYFDTNLFPKFDSSSSNDLKVKNFGGPVWGETPQTGTPNISRAVILPDIFNR